MSHHPNTDAPKFQPLPATTLPAPWGHFTVRYHDRDPGPNRCGSSRTVYDGEDTNTNEQLILQFVWDTSRSTSLKAIAESESTAKWKSESAIPSGENQATSSPMGASQQSGSKDRLGLPNRFELSLSAYLAAGWPAKVIVTRLGTDIRRYRITDFAGIGGMGEVWHAVDIASGTRRTPVVVKFFTHPLETMRSTQRTEANEDWIVEAAGYGAAEEGATGLDLTRSMDQHGIRSIAVRTREVITLDHDECPGWPREAIVMDRAATTLGEVLRICRTSTVRLSVDLVSGIWRSLVHALRELHDRFGLVHRDLKPDNVMFQFDDGADWDRNPESLLNARVLLGDLATLQESGSTVSWARTLGQDGWKAPELFQLDGYGKPTRISKPNQTTERWEDLWALGRMAGELADVLDPAEGTNDWLTKLASELQHEEPPRRPKASSSLALRGSPTWLARMEFLEQGGFRPDRHQYFHGRVWVRQAFDKFCQAQHAAGRGGLFLLVADAGLGKTALLTQWNTQPIRLTGDAEPGTSGSILKEPHPAFYFRHTENRTSHQQMLTSLCQHIAERFQLSLPEKGPYEIDTLEKLIKQASEKMPAGEALLIIVDGLDEAADPVTATTMLPRTLPAGVFVVAASRPAMASGHEHLNALNARGNEGGFLRFHLKADDPLNLKDAEEFWSREWQRLSGHAFASIQTGPNEVTELVQRNSGIFMILRSALDEMFPVEGQRSLTIDDFRQQKPCQTVVDWHRQQWDRIAARTGEDDQPDLIEFGTILAAVQDVIDIEQVAAVLGWKKSRTASFLQRTRWLLDRVDQHMSNGNTLVFIQRRHQSVLDFLLGTNGPAVSGLRDMHEQVASHYLTIGWGPQWRQRIANVTDPAPRWDNVNEYGLWFVVRHLLYSAREHDPSSANYITALQLLRDQLYHEERLGRGCQEDKP